MSDRDSSGSDQRLGAPAGGEFVIETEALVCPIAASLTLVGSRSATLLLREACAGISRFEDFTRRVGISPATAAAQLRGSAGHRVSADRILRAAVTR